LEKAYNYIIQGAGASGLWLAYSLLKEGLLEGGSLLIVERDASKCNDRTWCFWGEGLANEMPFTDFSWEQVQVFGTSQSIAPYTYHHCRSEAFYDFVKRALDSSKNIDWFCGEVLAVAQVGGRVDVNVCDAEAMQQTFVVDWFFGSGFDQKVVSEIELWQSFVGWRVKSVLGEPVFDARACTLMDFGIEQKGKTRFLYVLPFGETEALIEVTQFDKEKLTLAEGEQMLREICAQRGWDVSVMDTEFNAIPMSAHFDRSERFYASGSRVVTLGVAAGALKPTTGYGFLRMMQHGKAIAKALKKKTLIPTMYRARRFRFYDDLLLRILRKHPHRGKQIFDQLFHHKKASMVLRFLSEETNILQEIMIFMWLPKRLFLRTLFAKWVRL
jgi:lycopene beta-cyclase